MVITKETTMGEMLEYDRGIAYILMQSGMHCVGCPSSIHESLNEACMVHGLDVDVVFNQIQEYLNSKKQITKKTTMGEMLEYDRGIAYILMQSGMHCVGCPSSIHETLEEACMVHGLDVDEVFGQIQEYLNSKKA